MYIFGNRSSSRRKPGIVLFSPGSQVKKKAPAKYRST
jgi:hypothetical protein